MRPVEFPQQNHVLNEPEGWTPEECKPLPVFVGNTQEGFPVIISAWELSEEELKQIQDTGKVYLTVFGRAHPPVSLHVTPPFVVV